IITVPESSIAAGSIDPDASRTATALRDLTRAVRHHTEHGQRNQASDRADSACEGTVGWARALDVQRSSAKISSIVNSNSRASRNATGRLGSNFPVSMALIVCRET